MILKMRIDLRKVRFRVEIDEKVMFLIFAVVTGLEIQTPGRTRPRWLVQIICTRPALDARVISDTRRLAGLISPPAHLVRWFWFFCLRLFYLSNLLPGQ